MNDFASRIREANDDDRKQQKELESAYEAINPCLDAIENDLVKKLDSNDYKENIAGREVVSGGKQLSNCRFEKDYIEGNNDELYTSFIVEFGKRALAEGIELSYTLLGPDDESEKWVVIDPTVYSPTLLHVKKDSYEDIWSYENPTFPSFFSGSWKLMFRGRIVVPIKPTEESTSSSNETSQKKYRIEDESIIASMDNMDGTDFEAFCAELLKQNGYERVRQIGGSGDQGLDVLMEKDNIVYGIQIKRYESNVGNGAVQEAYSGKKYYNCNVGVVMTNSHFTKSAKKLAKTNSVVLWDREKVIEFIRKSDFYSEQESDNSELFIQDNYENGAESYFRSFLYDFKSVSIKGFLNVAEQAMDDFINWGPYSEASDLAWELYLDRENYEEVLLDLCTNAYDILKKIDEAQFYFTDTFNQNVAWNVGKVFGNPALQKELSVTESMVFELLLEETIQMVDIPIIRALKKTGTSAEVNQLLSIIQKKQLSLCEEYPMVESYYEEFKKLEEAPKIVSIKKNREGRP